MSLEPTLNSAHKIALLGFSPFEATTFESFFRLAARRSPGYLLVQDMSKADLMVVNADDDQAMSLCIASRSNAAVLLIGSDARHTGWEIERRPLNLMKVLQTIDRLLGGRTPAPEAPKPIENTRVSNGAPALASTPSARLEPTGRITSESKASTGNTPQLTKRSKNSVRTGPGAMNALPPTSSFIHGGAPSTLGDAPAELDYILVVDDSDIALKFMRNRLTRFGFHADLVSSGEEALGRMNVRPYKFVFLDVMMEGLDGYQTCRAIKQRKYSDGKPPVVIMLTSRGGTIDKIRGTLAGCDAYLTKPLNEQELITVLAKHDRTVARGFQDTNVGQESSGWA